MTTIAYLIGAGTICLIGTAAAGLGSFFFVTIAALFATLKAGGFIAWSWLWVAIPLWGVIGTTAAKLRHTASRRAARLGHRFKAG